MIPTSQDGCILFGEVIALLLTMCRHADIGDHEVSTAFTI
jgi:hypothetical protein